MLRIYELPFWLFGSAIVVVLLLAMEAGAWNGRRLIRSSRAPRKDQKNARNDLEVGALLALMGLVLAFTYSFGLSRIDLRKQALVHEANAIGTAFLRADLLPEPGRSELRNRLLEYARTRIMSDEAARSLSLTRKAIAKSVEAHRELWPTTERALQDDVAGHVQILVVQAMNDVIDSHTIRMAVGFDRLSPSVFAYLVILGALSVAFAAQNAELQRAMSRTRIGAFALALAALIFIIIDFDNSSRGLIRVSQDSLITVVADMEAALAR
jgi:drug/metabolite transporter (DMT)-like permease